VIHIAVHSFTPVLDDVVRDADIGILYDPARTSERTLAMAWKRMFDPALRVRCNVPYRGASDGLATALRKRWPASRYMGFELEINQRIVSDQSVEEDLEKLYGLLF
jgi:predicted N-formylglutamate amidohydrolase